MMMQKNKRFVLLTVLSILISFRAVAADKSWTIAAEKFTYTRNQSDAYYSGAAEMLPSRILENISANLYRTIDTKETVERETFDLKKERSSLILQLSSELKKRDALVFDNYTQKELKLKIADQEKKIKEIKTKIDENLERQKELEKIYEESENKTDDDKKKTNDYAVFFKKLFTSTDGQNKEELISLYKGDISTLHKPSDSALEAGYESRVFENEMVKAGINSLITGKITAYDDYLLIAVEVYLYPGARRIAAVNEVGTLDDADYICSNIARQLVPYLTNAMPIKLHFNIGPQETDIKLYIDDVLQPEIPDMIELDSGIHYIQFAAEDYKTIGTNYNFAGNNVYLIEATLEPYAKGYLSLDLFKPVESEGSFYANGLAVDKSQIVINGTAILGEFITAENNGAFFYIPEKLAVSGNNLTVKVNNFNVNDYIDKRRRNMYTSYSVLVTSLIPLFISKSYMNQYTAQGDEQKAKVWQGIRYGCMGVSIGSGVWLGYELVRYLSAANKVLPAEAKKAKEKN